jgi:hypothetical protein
MINKVNNYLRTVVATAENAGVDGRAIRYCPPVFIFGAIMTLFELFEAKPSKKKAEAPKPQNFVAKYAKTSGAGSHTEKKFTRKEKHKDSTKAD